MPQCLRTAQHVLGCDSCAEELLVRALQRRNRELPDTGLADPIVIWWKATAARNAAAMDRANRPLTVIHVTALATASLGAAGSALALWAGAPSVANSFEGLEMALGAMAVVMISAALLAFRRA